MIAQEKEPMQNLLCSGPQRGRAVLWEHDWLNLKVVLSKSRASTDLNLGF